MAMNIDHDDAVDPLGDAQLSGALPTVSNDPMWYTVGGNSTEMPGLQTPSGAFSPLSQPTATRFAPTSAAPTVGVPTSPANAPVRQSAQRKGPRIRLIIIGVVALVILGAYAVSALAASALHNITATKPPTQGMSTTQGQQGASGNQNHPGSATPAPSPRPKGSPTATPSATAPSWFTQNLPASCSSADVTQIQADQANEEAAEFTQREEYISFQAPGSLTSSTNLMTTNAKNLRFVNDRRSTTAFAQQLQNGPANKGLIQVPGNLQPQIARCQRQNGNVFAWVSVSFSLAIQCQTDAQGNPCSPNPQGLPEMDPQTHQPKIHTMAVLLIAVPKGTPNPPLWLGWNVSDYMIDVSTTSLTIPDQP